MKETSIDDLIADSANARKHTSRSQTALMESIASLGLARAVVIDADGIVRAGNGTLQAAKACGKTKVLIVPSDGSRLVAVRRKDLTPAQARALAIADNRTGELSEWDGENLQSAADIVRGAGINLEQSIGFSDKELDGMIARSLTGTEEPSTESEGSGPKNPHSEFVADDQSGGSSEMWRVVVWCESEREREVLQDQLMEKGRRCSRLDR